MEKITIVINQLNQSKRSKALDLRQLEVGYVQFWKSMEIYTIVKLLVRINKCIKRFDVFISVNFLKNMINLPVLFENKTTRK